MTEGSFRLSFPPTSQVQSIFLFFPFHLFFYTFLLDFFFYVVRKTVVSMKLFEPEPHKNGWVLPMSEWHHEKETPYCEYHFRIVMFTIVCKLCFIPTVTMYCMESV